MTDTTLRQALAFTARGWPVLPCQPGRKTPVTRHGVRDATTDPDQITTWFGRHPDWNLAIATGAPGPDVLDIDEHGEAGNGYPAFRQLRTAGLLDGAAAYVRTPSGGCTSTSADQSSATATCPPTTWTSAPKAAMSSPRPPESTAGPTSW